MKLKTTLLILFWPILLQCNSFGQLAISGLTALGAAPDSGDLIPIVDISDLTQSANGSTKKVTFSYLLGIGSLTQAYDADLTTYAGITPSANIQSLLGSADYATARTNLGLAIGTNVQAYDADLTTYAGITPSADIQSFLAAANDAAAVSALGAATSAQGALADTSIQRGATDLAGGTALTINTNYFDSFTAIRTLTFSGTPANGSTVNLSFDSDGTYTLTIPTSYPIYSSGSTTTMTFPEGENTVRWWFEDGKWRVAATTITEESFSFPIVEPDLIQAVRDTVLLKKFPAEIYPNGFTLTAAHIDVSASVTSNTHLIEIWDTSVDVTPTLAESITLTAASTAEDDGTFSSAAVPADGWVAIDLDAATENMEELIVTIIGYAN